MYLPPLAFPDMALLLAVGTIALLITVELTSTDYGQTNLIINKRKLKNISLIIGLLFLITITITIINIMQAT